MTLKTKIAVLKAMAENDLAISRMYGREGKKELEKQYFCEWSAVAGAIAVLEDNKYANAVAKIYGVEAQ